MPSETSMSQMISQPRRRPKSSGRGARGLLGATTKPIVGRWVADQPDRGWFMPVGVAAGRTSTCFRGHAARGRGRRLAVAPLRDGELAPADVEVRALDAEALAQEQRAAREDRV